MYLLSVAIRISFCCICCPIPYGGHPCTHPYYVVAPIPLYHRLQPIVPKKRITVYKIVSHERWLCARFFYLLADICFNINVLVRFLGVPTPFFDELVKYVMLFLFIFLIKYSVTFNNKKS